MIDYDLFDDRRFRESGGVPQAIVELSRVPTFRPDPDREEVTVGGLVLGMEALPLVWDRR